MFDLYHAVRNRENLKNVHLYLGKEVNRVGYQGKDIVYIPEVISIPGVQLDRHLQPEIDVYIYIVDREALISELKVLREKNKLHLWAIELIDHLEDLDYPLVFVSNQHIVVPDGIYHKIKLLSVKNREKYRL